MYANGLCKREAPVFDGSKVEALFYCLIEFRDIAKYLEFVMGSNLFDNFCMTLSGVAKEHWVSVVTQIMARTQESFEVCVKGDPSQWM